METKGVDSRKFGEETEITAAFQKNILSGSAGCNQYNTGYQVNDDTLKVNQAIATTKKACPEPQMKQENQYLAALQGVEQFQVTAKGDLQLFYRTPEGLGILTFTPAPTTTRTEKTIYIILGNNPVAKDQPKTVYRCEKNQRKSGDCSLIVSMDLIINQDFSIKLKLALKPSPIPLLIKIRKHGSY